jgi:Zn-dependent peptidase ImmA (M78 family)
MSLRRGFKAEAERIALEVRHELSLKATVRLDPLVLAEHLCVPVLTIGECLKASENQEAIKLLLDSESDSFSAVTVFFGERRVIVHNEGHAVTRQASSVAHELAHCLLEHPPGPVRSCHGCRYWDSNMEDEADWLAAALLVPREGALWLVRRGHGVDAIAVHYGVSTRLCRWRINQTGVLRQVRRLRK